MRMFFAAMQSSAARVINQSDSVTRYEETELHNKLLGIKVLKTEEVVCDTDLDSKTVFFVCLKFLV